MCLSNIGDILNPAKWFKAPKVSVPQIIIPEATQAPVTPPTAPLKPPRIRDSAGASDLSKFSSSLNPTLSAILGLNVPDTSLGLSTPGAQR